MSLKRHSPPGGGWERIYREIPEEQIPWNAAGPDPDLKRLVENKTLTPASALDAGAGLAYDMIFLAQHGFTVRGLDNAPSAIKMGRAQLTEAGLDEKLLEELDLIEADFSPGAFELIHDRGTFHALAEEEFPICAGLYANWLRPGGHLLLRVFSKAAGEGPGPRRFSIDELAALFEKDFSFLEKKVGVFAGPRKPPAHFCLLRRR